MIWQCTPPTFSQDFFGFHFLVQGSTYGLLVAEKEDSRRCSGPESVTHSGKHLVNCHGFILLLLLRCLRFKPLFCFLFSTILVCTMKSANLYPRLQVANRNSLCHGAVTPEVRQPAWNEGRTFVCSATKTLYLCILRAGGLCAGQWEWASLAGIGVTSSAQRGGHWTITEAAEGVTGWLWMKRPNPWIIAAGMWSGTRSVPDGRSDVERPETLSEPRNITEDAALRSILKLVQNYRSLLGKRWSVFKINM